MIKNIVQYDLVILGGAIHKEIGLNNPINTD